MIRCDGGTKVLSRRTDRSYAIHCTILIAELIMESFEWRGSPMTDFAQNVVVQLLESCGLSTLFFYLGNTKSLQSLP